MPGKLSKLALTHGGDAATYENGQVGDPPRSESRHDLAEVEEIVGFGVWTWDLASGEVQWSVQLQRIYGLEPGTFEGTVDGFLSRIHPADREHVWSKVSAAVESGSSFVFEERIIRADGQERTLLSNGRTRMDAQGTVRSLVGVCHDVTDRVEAQRVSGLSERRIRAIMDNSPSMITVKDLEGRYRMVSGETGRILDLPPEDVLGHTCSELFPPEVSAQYIANDQLAASEGRPVYDETIIEVLGETRAYTTVTFSLPDDDGRPAETCTIATDVTERVQHDVEQRERLILAQRIGGAIADGRMLVFAQPIVNLASGEAHACELLVRMRGDRGAEDLIEPSAFLPAAERFGLVQLIDGWMLSEALRRSPSMVLQVNLSAVTLCDAQARNAIVESLRAAPQAAPRIVFEVTETAALEHLEAACAFAHAVTELGCALALDDFGVGFGSFTYLRMLPVKYLKIDMRFVRELETSEDDRRVVQSIVGIARNFGLLTIAEGVENAQTMELVRQLGADFAQGFHLGRPAPVDSVLDAL